jgi:hypothetical protein
MDFELTVIRRFDQGRIASDFMKAFKISKNTQEGLTRTLKSSCGSVSPLQICIKPHWRPLYLLELEVSRVAADFSCLSDADADINRSSHTVQASPS